MQKMLEAMKQINSAIEKISQISLLIEYISSETNLLSLNASIEAASAGEAGHGFAVVASEIGHLSSQTAEAFLQIREVTEQFRTISSELSGTVEEQTLAVNAINSQLASLQDIADSNKGMAEEMADMAADSLTQSENLKNYVAQVKIKDHI